MRFVFLVPDLVKDPRRLALDGFVKRSRLGPLKKLVLGDIPALRTDTVWGGTLNIMRHCWVARQQGLDAMLATPSGDDTYGKRWGIFDLPFVAWSDRRPTDVCIVPDFVTQLVDEVPGPAIAYLQVPTHLRADFDYLDPRVALWTDSPHMLALCEKAYPNKFIEIVPNIVDDGVFPFVPQSEREPIVFAFPRKGPEYIDAAERSYAARGGTHFRFQRIDGVPLHELARMFRRPQVFLASAEIEGCALPPQESMASGIVVCGRSAQGANFAMEHRKTAMIAETPEDAAACLRELESEALRTELATNAYEHIRRYFPSAEPAKFWREVSARYVVRDGAAQPASPGPASRHA